MLRGALLARIHELLDEARRGIRCRRSRSVGYLPNGNSWERPSLAIFNGLSDQVPKRHAENQ